MIPSTCPSVPWTMVTLVPSAVRISWLEIALKNLFAVPATTGCEVEATIVVSCCALAVVASKDNSSAGQIATFIVPSPLIYRRKRDRLSKRAKQRFSSTSRGFGIRRMMRRPCASSRGPSSIQRSRGCNQGLKKNRAYLGPGSRFIALVPHPTAEQRRVVLHKSLNSLDFFNVSCYNRENGNVPQDQGRVTTMNRAIVRECENCGSEYFVDHPRQRWCCAECREEARNEQRTAQRRLWAKLGKPSVAEIEESAA
jgi:hypothetical protein